MKLLDLFCGEGGACKGYQDAGFDVTGVDLKPVGKRYPGTFIQADAMAYVRTHWREYDAIHASPPCQAYSIATAGNPGARARHERLIPAVREELQQSGLPFVIENVQLAKKELVNPQLLCGRMFGLTALDIDDVQLVLDRHRLFEANWNLTVPEHLQHDPAVQVAGVYGGSRRSSKANATPADDRYAARNERHGGYVPRSKTVQQQLLGIDWMTVKGMQESIPPAYSYWIGNQLMDVCK